MEASHVIKRNGDRAAVRFDAITDRNEALCSAAYGRSLDFIVPRLAAITQEVIHRFVNGMTTHELDMLTVAVCAAQSTQHRDFSDLAARIVVSDLQKTTANSFVETVRRIAAGTDSDGRSVSRLSDEFVGIVERAGSEIDRRIDYSRDFGFTYFGIQTMLRSYLLREANKKDAPAVERPQHTYMRVALGICVARADGAGHEAEEPIFRERLERAFKVYDQLSTHKLSHASPTIFNAGTKHPQLSSCFLLRVDDDLDTILQVDKDAGMISQRAGGIGVCLTPMRAEGALIRTTGGASSGLRLFLRKLNMGQLYVNQGGSRPGAYAVYLEAWHDDIFAFLEMGRFKGVADNAPDLKYALWVPDLFMEAVRAELADPGAGDWPLFSPDRAPGLHECHGEEFRELHARYVREKRHTRVVKASAIVAEWFKTVAQKGNPYVLFKDHINRKSNLSHVRTISHSNLCVAGETRVLTDVGQLPIGALVDQEVSVWNGAEWSAVTVRQTAPAAALVRVAFDNGAVLDCTPEHKFYDCEGVELRAGALEPGTRLEKAAAWPVVDGGAPFAHAYTHGLYTAADGHSHRGRPAIQLYGDKQALLDDPRFEIDGDRPLYVNDDLERTTVFLPPGLPPKFAVPVNASLESRLRWFEGYCDGDGCLARNGSSLTLQAWSTELEFLRQVRLMLQTMGCDPKIVGGGPARVASIRGRDYACRETWRLLVDGADLWTLIGLGFTPGRLSFAGGTPPNRDARCHARVVSVEPLEEPAPTFCFTEPLRGRGVFEGILTGQCAEITIPSWYDEGRPGEAEYGVCNLAALPLASFVTPDARAKNPGRMRIDWEGLSNAAQVAVENLDNVIDINHYPVEACRRSNLRHRPVALGVMGLADVIALFGYAYGSFEAQALDRALHAVVYFGAMTASSRLGEERGNFSSFEGSAAQRGFLQPDLWVEAGHLEEDWAIEVENVTGGYLTCEQWGRLRKACSAHLRNGYVTADMPTATSSQATGQNECFEPFTSNVYTRKTLAGEFTLLNPHLLRELEGRGLWDDEMRRALVASAGSVQGIGRIPAEVRGRYRTARELDQRLLTDHAKARNPFLSQTMSLNYYFGEPLLRDALTVLLRGWEAGLTTGSYYIHTQPAAGSQKTALIRPPMYGRASADGPAVGEKPEQGRPPPRACTSDCTSCAL